MGQNITVTGMVLTAMPVGDYDKRITILTRERGKITAFARGARRSNSQILAASNPFVFGSFEVFEGRNTYTMTKAEVSNYFRELTSNYDMVCYAAYFTEIAEYYGQENTDERERLKLLYQSLRALESEKFPFSLIRNIYELKTMVINGEYPNVFSCFQCGKEEHLTAFSVRLRGVVCQDCMKEAGGTPISQSLLYALQYIISSPIQKLYTFMLTPQVLEEFTAFMKKYQVAYQEHTYKSESFLNDL